jgi:hypothetical protein
MDETLKIFFKAIWILWKAMATSPATTHSIGPQHKEHKAFDFYDGGLGFQLITYYLLLAMNTFQLFSVTVTHSM